MGKKLADPELEAMKAVTEALEGLSEMARHRVLRWAFDRYVGEAIISNFRMEVGGHAGGETADPPKVSAMEEGA